MKCPNCGFVIEPRRYQRQSNLFHKLNAAYARAQALDPAVTKVELKYWFGAWVPYPFDEVPEWPGRFVEIESDQCIVYLKSESAYTKQEETALIEGVIGRCIDVGADIRFMEDM